MPLSPRGSDCAASVRCRDDPCPRRHRRLHGGRRAGRGLRNACLGLLLADDHVRRRLDRRSRSRSHSGRERRCLDGLDGRSRHRGTRSLAHRFRLRGERGARRQELHRVEVTLFVRRRANAEIDERFGRLDRSARSDRPDDVALRHFRAARHSNRAEMYECQRQPELGSDRHGPPAARDGSRERGDSTEGCAHVCPRGRTEVDASVLARRVWMGAVEGERTYHRPVNRPSPRLRRRNGEGERAEDQDANSP